MKYTKLQGYLLTLIFLALILFFFKTSYKNIADYFAPYILGKINYEQVLFDKNFYQTRVDFLIKEFSNKPHKTEIIFIGDSHIQQFANKELIIKESVNIGVSGQTTVGLIKTLEKIDWQISGEKLLLLIGYNDFKYRSKDETLKKLSLTINLLKHKLNLNNQDIYLLSLLPVDKNRAVVNEKISILNKQIKAKSKEIGFNYLDINSLFIINNRQDTQYFKKDLVHLNAEGYLKLSTYLNSELTKENENANTKN